MATSETITVREITANGLTFRCRESGSEGEPVILLHGFPETSHMWVGLIPALVAAGYRVLAPDQRGYSPGARPEGKEHYTYADIAGDVFALADAWGADRFHLVGHDWGAGAGWSAVAMNPGRIASWSALSVPHIGAFGRAIREDADQANRSQYITFFQEPGVAEAALSADDYAALKAIWTESSPEEVAEYLSVFRQPGALTAALNWYRGSAGISPDNQPAAFGDVHLPTLLIWGNGDQAIGRKGVEDGAQFMKGYYRFVELDAGHWLTQEKPDEVRDEIIAHLQKHPIS
ncbi:MAG: alpha/beta fold hydrolase [Hyphomicrobiales bacterium]